MAKRNEKPFTLIGYTDKQDLRKITKNTRFLKRQERSFGMNNGDAVLFVNTAFTLFRIVWKTSDKMWLLQPESGEGTKQLSVYLRISEELTNLSDAMVTVNLNDVIELTQKRIARRKEMQKRQKRLKLG